MTEELLAAKIKSTLTSDNTEELKRVLSELLMAYEKNTMRLSKITKQSDKQQNQVLKLNDDLEKAYSELNEYKNNLEIKVEEETAKRLDQEKILLQNAKMAEMGGMLGAIIHQWKQPITIISMLSDIMSRDIEMNEVDVEDMKDNMYTIKERVLFLSHTIDDFRNFFKPDKEPKSFSPKTVVEEIVKIIEHQILKYKATVRVDGQGDVFAMGFPNEIKHVVLNLLNNALEASSENAAKTNLKPQILINIAQTADDAVILISDNGGGIPDAIMKNLFKPYNSSKGDAGTGIGLTLAKTIIEEHHGGQISARNTSIGAEFTITMPKKRG